MISVMNKSLFVVRMVMCILGHTRYESGNGVMVISMEILSKECIKRVLAQVLESLLSRVEKLLLELLRTIHIPKEHTNGRINLKINQLIS